MGSVELLRIKILLVLGVVAVASALVGAFRKSQQLWKPPSRGLKALLRFIRANFAWRELSLNVGTELIGALVTYLLIGQVLESEITRDQLIRQLGSSVQDVAVSAAEEVRNHGWLYDGTLRGAELSYANLQGANLWDADLQGAVLVGADLQRAYLVDAKLQRAKLIDAKLQRASLMDAKLQRADLLYADLQRANLRGADLRGADLEDANLQGAILVEAWFDENTILPDQTRWTPDTDMARFTDLNHPTFWRSDYRRSPAYRGSEEEQGTE